MCSGGVPAWSGGVSVPGGGVPAWSGAVSAPGGVPAWSGGGTCLVGGVPGQVLPPPMNRMNDRTGVKILPWPKLRFGR